jgi:hypothetical protein
LLNDFKVYYSASQALMNGDEPYGVAFGLSSGYFKYSPVTLFLFSPYTLASFETAKIIHFVVISLSSIFVLLFGYRLCSDYFGYDLRRPSLLLMLMLVLAAVHLTRELHLGNINMILLLLFLLAVYLLQERRLYTSGLLWALMFLLKPYFLILLLPMIAARQVKLLAITVVATVALLLLPAAFMGFDANTAMLADWMAVMRGHAGGFSEHTFSSIVTSYSGIPLSHAAQYIFVAGTAILYAAIRINEFRRKKLYSPKQQVFDLFILLAFVPNLVITDSQHFLFSVPLIFLVIAYLQQEVKWYLVLAFTVLWFFYGANSNDLLGNPLSDAFDTYSTIGVANLGLILLLIFTDWRLYRKG